MQINPQKIYLSPKFIFIDFKLDIFQHFSHERQLKEID